MQKTVVIPLEKILEIALFISFDLAILGIVTGLIIGLIIGYLDRFSSNPKSSVYDVVLASITYSIIFALGGGFLGGLFGHLQVYGFSPPVEDINNTGWGDIRTAFPIFYSFFFGIIFAFIGAAGGPVILLNRSKRR